MGQVRHGSATTTYADRAEMKRLQASLATPGRESGINSKTVAKWRKRQTVEDLRIGPREPRSTILTDNGIQFAEQPRNRNTIISRPVRFDMICEGNGIEHQLTRPNHPWTNGQVERMNRTIKDATVKRFHSDDHGQLRIHPTDVLAA